VTRRQILLAFPVFSQVYPAPFENFIAMAVNTHQLARHYQFAVKVVARSPVHSAMNTLADLTIRGGFDAMIACDDDCLPPPEAIGRLVAHFEDGRDIVAGIGFTRNFPHTTTVGRYCPEGVTLFTDADAGIVKLQGFYWVDDVSAEPADLIPCDFCGFPIGLISRHALETVGNPWFETTLDGGGCTHDVSFCTKAKRLGIQTYVDRTIPCGHLGEAPTITFGNRAVVRGVAEAIKRVERAVPPMTEPVPVLGSPA
jgi:hypothetical protein